MLNVPDETVGVDPTPIRDLELSDEQIVYHISQCAVSVEYFVRNFCFIYDAHKLDWIPFELWDSQIEVLETIVGNRKIIILKARQLGLTWLCIAYALYVMLFNPIATVLFFSRRDDEAIDLLEHRLQGMYERLPSWMKRDKIVISNKHEFALSNGSRAKAFPTTAGDSYTATLAIVDEADLVPNLNRLLRSVKPTISDGGQLILLSRVDKDTPGSPFKSLYVGSKNGKNDYANIFLGWDARPDRTVEWYLAEKNEAETMDGSTDSVYEQYPATDIEALAEKQGKKRFPFKWLKPCDFTHEDAIPLSELRGFPPIDDLEVFELPRRNDEYVVGIDAAEGLQKSDDSVVMVINRLTGKEACTLAGKYTPTQTAMYAETLALIYNFAPVLTERQNHGHAIITYFETSSSGVRLLTPDEIIYNGDTNAGWSQTTINKIAMYDTLAQALLEHDIQICSPETLSQISSIDKDTLSAPPAVTVDGENIYKDDRAIALGLCNLARRSSQQNIGVLNKKEPLPTGGARDLTEDEIDRIMEARSKKDRSAKKQRRRGR